MSDTLVYRSETGVVSEAPMIVEHIASKTLRVNDPQFGLKTAAKTVHDRVAREKFLAQKAEVSAKQRNREASKKQAKIDALDADIARISASLLSKTSSDPARAKALIDTLTAKRAALV